MKILLVEPDKILSEVTESALTAVGHDIATARSAQHALDVLDEYMPDLVILEIQLGLHNGIEFLYEVRSYPEWQHIPAVIYTLNSRTLDRQFAPALEDLRVSAVLYKPHTTTNRLVEVVNGLFVS